jgi:hypothetical protein
MARHPSVRERSNIQGRHEWPIRQPFDRRALILALTSESSDGKRQSRANEYVPVDAIEWTDLQACSLQTHVSCTVQSASSIWK